MLFVLIKMIQSYLTAGALNFSEKGRKKKEKKDILAYPHPTSRGEREREGGGERRRRRRWRWWFVGLQKDYTVSILSTIMTFSYFLVFRYFIDFKTYLLNLEMLSQVFFFSFSFFS